MKVEAEQLIQSLRYSAASYEEALQRGRSMQLQSKNANLYNST